MCIRDRRCRILCGISEDNTKKLGLLTVLLEKSRDDIEAFCRDTFIEALTNDEGIITGYTDVFPKQLKNVPVSYTHLDVYKRQGLCGKHTESYKSGKR